jgi:hypothetical protein
MAISEFLSMKGVTYVDQASSKLAGNASGDDGNCRPCNPAFVFDLLFGRACAEQGRPDSGKASRPCA